MTDVIRRVNLELNGVDRDALRRGHRAGEWAEDRLVPELERIVANYPTRDRLVAIDRLDIAVNVAEWSAWEGALLDGLRRELSALLDAELQRNTAQPAARAGSGEAAPMKTWRPRGVVDALRFYLEHGRLPWYRISGTFAEEVKGWADAASAETLVAELAPLLEAPEATRRLIRELPEEALASLLERALFLPVSRSRRWTAEVEVLRELLREALATSGHTPTANVVPSLAVAPGYSLPEALWVALLVEWAHEPAARATYRKAVSRFVASCLAEARALGWSDEHVEPAASARSSETARSDGDSPMTPFAASEFRDAFLQARTSAEPPVAPAVRRPVAHSSDAEAKEGYFVANAGTVLLAPYLRRYLERLGHVRDGRIDDPAAALVAVHFLATGRDEAPREHELVLTKVLCGLPLEDAPPPLGAPDARTRSEADVLLASIVEHWAVLRKTSVAGLREAFLQRDGKLSLSPRGNWLLQVEQKAYDLLLGQLPWSYRMIQLPWMERMLVTEWVD